MGANNQGPRSSFSFETLLTSTILPIALSTLLLFSIASIFFPIFLHTEERNALIQLAMQSRLYLFIITVTSLWIIIKKEQGLFSYPFINLSLLGLAGLLCFIFIGNKENLHSFLFEPYLLTSPSLLLVSLHFIGLTLASTVGFFLQAEKSHLGRLISGLLVITGLAIGLTYSVNLFVRVLEVEQSLFLINFSQIGLATSFYSILMLALWMQMSHLNLSNIKTRTVGLSFLLMAFGCSLFFQLSNTDLRIFGLGLFIFSNLIMLRNLLIPKALKSLVNYPESLFIFATVLFTILLMILSIFRQFFWSDFQFFDILVAVPLSLSLLKPSLASLTRSAARQRVFNLVSATHFISGFALVILAHQGSKAGDFYFLFETTEFSLLSKLLLFTLSVSHFIFWVIPLLNEDSKSRPEPSINNNPIFAREGAEPDEADRPWPLLIWVTVITFISWGTIYLALYGGDGTSSGGDQRSSQTQEADDLKVDGAKVYRAHCVACHQSNGEGLSGAFPPLALSEWVTGDPRVVAKVILGGLRGEIVVRGNRYNGVMPAFNQLSNQEIAAVVNHVRNSWGNEGKSIEIEIVEELRNELNGRGKPWTAAEIQSLNQ